MKKINIKNDLRIKIPTTLFKNNSAVSAIIHYKFSFYKNMLTHERVRNNLYYQILNHNSATFKNNFRI